MPSLCANEQALKRPNSSSVFLKNREQKKRKKLSKPIMDNCKSQNLNALCYKYDHFNDVRLPFRKRF